MQGRIWKRSKSRKSKKSSPDWRLLTVMVFWLLCLSAVVAKLVYVQVVASSRYSATARKHLEKKRDLEPRRGTIVDRNQKTIAEDIIQYTVAVQTDEVDSLRKTARGLANILALPYSDIVKRISVKGKYVYLERGLSDQKAIKLRNLRLGGVKLEKSYRRFYRYNELAAHLIGYCDYDNKAQGGLELEYNKQLTGTPGWKMLLRDARGNYRTNFDFQTEKPVDGYRLETTIDMVYQEVVEDELAKAVKTFKAESGSIVLMDPRTGAVLSMANFPTFDPNNYHAYKLENFRNRAITDPNEPGSTFKMVSLALAIERLGLNLDNNPIFCENGKYTLYDKVVKDHAKFAWLTPRSIFEKSSNIGVIKLSSRFNPLHFYKYARDFGFGNRSTIDLPAEANGLLRRPNEFHGASVAYMSMGYEVMVTPLQLASAYAAIANDGVLMQPRVVDRVLSENGKLIKEYPPMEIRRVISRSSAQQMKKVLTGVVERGTGKNAAIEGVTIAGKTGTAQKLDRLTKIYSDEQHSASFAGFFPVEKPRFVMLVFINRPKGAYYGGEVAAPVFRKIAHRISGLPREQYLADYQIEMAEALPLSDRLIDLVDIQKAVNLFSGGDAETSIEHVNHGGDVYNIGVTPRELPENHGGRLPNLVGMTLREALVSLPPQVDAPQILGSGIIVKQVPEAGTVLEQGAKLKLICQDSE